MKRKNPHAVALGSLGGRVRMKGLSSGERSNLSKRGGTARAKKLSAKQRSRIAKLAVVARERKRREGGQR